MSIATDRPSLRWDTLQVTLDWIEQEKEDDPDFAALSDDEQFKHACRNPFLLDDEWQSLTECLTDWMQELNADGVWRAEVSNFGWQKLSGYKVFTADTGSELLEAILPKTECSFTIHQEGDTLVLNNAHHDAPCGGEVYRIRAATEADRQ